MEFTSLCFKIKTNYFYWKAFIDGIEWKCKQILFISHSESAELILEGYLQWQIVIRWSYRHLDCKEGVKGCSTQFCNFVIYLLYFAKPIQCAVNCKDNSTRWTNVTKYCQFFCFIVLINIYTSLSIYYTQLCDTT